MSFRTYFDVQGNDASRLGEQVAMQRERIAARLADVGRVVAIMSGKGGVGKSYVTAALAVALARESDVGVVDADLQSPTVARLLGATSRGPLRVHEDGVEPGVGLEDIRVMSSDLLLDDGRALRWTSDAGEEHIWRGAAESGVLREFLSDVAWGTLDVLLIDMPPDASRVADLATLVPGVAGAIAVTIPTMESERSVARALDAAREAHVPVLGIVENMSGYCCLTCGDIGPLFEGRAATHLSAAYDAPVLARVPFTRAPMEDLRDMLAPVARAVLAARRAEVR